MDEIMVGGWYVKRNGAQFNDVGGYVAEVISLNGAWFMLRSFDGKKAHAYSHLAAKELGPAYRPQPNWTRDTGIRVYTFQRSWGLFEAGTQCRVIASTGRSGGMLLQCITQSGLPFLLAQEFFLELCREETIEPPTMETRAKDIEKRDWTPWLPAEPLPRRANSPRMEIGEVWAMREGKMGVVVRVDSICGTRAGCTVLASNEERYPKGYTNFGIVSDRSGLHAACIQSLALSEPVRPGIQYAVGGEHLGKPAELAISKDDVVSKAQIKCTVFETVVDWTIPLSLTRLNRCRIGSCNNPPPYSYQGECFEHHKRYEQSIARTMDTEGRNPQLVAAKQAAEKAAAEAKARREAKLQAAGAAPQSHNVSAGIGVWDLRSRR